MKRKKRTSRKELRLTDNSRVYKMAKREMDLDGCPLCPPNKGCNTNRDGDNNWKKYRKTQWKE